MGGRCEAATTSPFAFVATTHKKRGSRSFCCRSNCEALEPSTAGVTTVPAGAVFAAPAPVLAGCGSKLGFAFAPARFVPAAAAMTSGSADRRFTSETRSVTNCETWLLYNCAIVLKLFPMLSSRDLSARSVKIRPMTLRGTITISRLTKSFVMETFTSSRSMSHLHASFSREACHEPGSRRHGRAFGPGPIVAASRLDHTPIGVGRDGVLCCEEKRSHLAR